MNGQEEIKIEGNNENNDDNKVGENLDFDPIDYVDLRFSKEQDEENEITKKQNQIQNIPNKKNHSLQKIKKIVLNFKQIIKEQEAKNQNENSDYLELKESFEEIVDSAINELPEIFHNHIARKGKNFIRISKIALIYSNSLIEAANTLTFSSFHEMILKNTLEYSSIFYFNKVI